MAVVWIPSLMRDLTGGQGQVSAPGKTVREVINTLNEAYPGIKARLCDGDRLDPALSVFVDGKMTPRGLSATVGEESEIHFLPAVGGG
jgi:molybdopterin synthase sulfur carrier subunit